MEKRLIGSEEIAGVLPGPIALVTTVNGNGHANVAPKSWISGVTRNLLVIGCHRDHHTAQNLLANGECVLNFPADDLVHQVWDAHLYREPGPNELEARGFTPLPALQVRPPRIAECRIHIEGRLESVKWYGDECVLFVETLCTSVDAAALESPDPCTHLRPIFYLAPGTFGVLERSHALTRKEKEA
ncbi:MAG: flavin reductase family protein [Bacillota bacterium]